MPSRKGLGLCGDALRAAVLFSDQSWPPPPSQHFVFRSSERTITSYPSHRAVALGPGPHGRVSAQQVPSGRYASGRRPDGRRHILFFLFLAQEQTVICGAHVPPGGGEFTPRQQRSGSALRPAAEATAGRPARCSALPAASSRRRSLPVLDRFQRAVRAAASAGVQGGCEGPGCRR